MRKGLRLLSSSAALVMIIGAIFFAGKPQPSSAQNAPFKSYQLIVHCGDPQLPAAMFWHDVKEHSMGLNSICVGNCPGGGGVTLENALAGLPADVSAALKAQVEKHRFAREGWFITCLGGGKEPPEDKKPKCDPPSEGSEDGPWNPADCKDYQDVKFTVTGRTLVVSGCGQVLYKSTSDGADPKFVGMIRDTWPNKICCDKLKGPRNTPCDYSVDLDCDGTPNGRDYFPDNYGGEESFYGTPDNAKVDPLPKGLRLSQLLPDIACDGCKWELVKGEKKCTAKSSGTGLFWYEATWKCPKTGMEVWRTSKQRLLRQKCK